MEDGASTGSIADGWEDWLERLKSGIPDYLATPWPDLDPIADIAYNSRIAFVAQRGQHEATVGRRLAAHVALTAPVLLFTGFPPSSIPDALVIEDEPFPTPDHVQAAVDRMTRKGDAPALVVIERFERMTLSGGRPEGLTRVEELEEVGDQIRRASADRNCPLVWTTVTDEFPDFRRHIVHWAGVDSPAAILTDYSSRVIALRRRDDEVVEAVVEADDWANPATVRELAWARPAGARPAATAPAEVEQVETKPITYVPPQRVVAEPQALMGGIQALETGYAGHLFRSRLEARWAVFFDALKIPWEYEAERYQLPSGKYLPDFWLPRQELFYEVKGVAPTVAYRRLLEELSVGTGHRVALAVGSIPDPARYAPGSEGESDFWIDTYEPTVDTGLVERQAWTQCAKCSFFDLRHEGIGRLAGCGCKEGTLECGQLAPRTVLEAMRAARSARFEHGQSGAPA